MDENFSSRVKDVIQYSKEEALRLGHLHIGTEHLILGMIREGECMAIEILLSLGVDVKLLRKSIEDVSVSSANSGSSDRSNLPLTKQAEKALKTTFLEAKLFDSNLIGTPHLLLCVLRNDSDPIYQLLYQQGITYDVVKEQFESREGSEFKEDLKSQDTFSDDEDFQSSADDKQSFKSSKSKPSSSKSNESSDLSILNKTFMSALANLFAAKLTLSDVAGFSKATFFVI
mgnify:CR=1 FL=1